MKKLLLTCFLLASIVLLKAQGNTQPVANDDYASTCPGATVQIGVAYNDYDGWSNNDTSGYIDWSSVQIVDPPLHGTASVNPNGFIEYTPDNGFTGVDTMSYSIADNDGARDTALVWIQVESTMDAQDDYASTYDGMSVYIDVLTNDVPNNGEHFLSVIDGPSHGQADADSYGISYFPNQGFTGWDTLIYKVCNFCDPASCDSAVVLINVVERQDTCWAYYYYEQTSPFTVSFVNYSSGNYGQKVFWDFGDGSSSTEYDPIHTYPKEGEYYVCLTIGDSTTGCRGSFCQLVVVSEQNMNCQADFYYYPAFDSTQEKQSRNYFFYVYLSNSSRYEPDSVRWDFGDGTISTVDSGGWTEHVFPDYDTFKVCATIYVDTCVTYVCHEVVVSRSPSSISGIVYFDANENGQYDYPEEGLDNRIVKLEPGGYVTSTSEYGYYYLAVSDTGKFKLSTVLPSNWAQTEPSMPEYDLHIADYGTYISKNFGQRPDTTVQDLRVILTPSWAFRPGFDASYYITYSNIGGKTIDGRVELDYDSRLTYLNSSPSHNSYDVVTHQLGWDFTGLMPGESRNIIVNLNVAPPPTVNIEDTICSTARVLPLTGDNAPANNVDMECLAVRGSYDPNDKAVVPSGVGSDGKTLKNQTLTYTIRFQNTGTDTAFNIVVRDTIHPNLELATLEVVAASHPYQLEILPNREVWFRFNNILLVDSFNNELLSHGFLTYTIVMKKDLAIGEKITNTAGIYFDFNPPVVTNTTVNTIADLTGIRENRDGGQQSVVYPNPFSGTATLYFENRKSEKFEFKVTDLTGRVVQRVTNLTGSHYTIRRGELTKGMYLYTLSSKEGTLSGGKFVIE